MSQKKVNPKVIKPPVKAAVAKKDSWYKKHLTLIFIAALFLVLSLLFFSVAFRDMEPMASDITQWQGSAKSIIDYNSAHKDRALWTNSMFSGMPSYMISFPNRYPFLESITKLMDRLMNWRIFLLFIGGLGVFFLIKLLKMDDFIAFFAAISFVLSCHWVGLLEIGHNTKFMAMMYVPWVVWGVIYLRQKPGFLSLGLFSAFLIMQLRQNHPQITYYLYLFLGMYWLYELIISVKDKDMKGFGLWTLLFILAFGITALAVMNPYMSTMEYSHYTMRGGAEGLDKAYAQGWSFHPKEILGLIIPDFFGGINESYWGYMPFTQVYNYFGIVVLLLGILSLTGKEKRLSIFLWLSSLFFLVISFGSATPALSDLFLKYLPFFNKFRVPSMSLVIWQFNAVILAALGIKSVIDNGDDPFWQKRYKTGFWIMGGIYLFWLLFARKVFGSLPFATAAQIEQYTQANAMSQLNKIKELRLSALYKSGVLSLLFATITIGMVYLKSIGKLKKELFVLILVLFSFIDLWPYTGKHLKDLYPRKNRLNRYNIGDYDAFLLQDKDSYRIYPFRTNSIRPAGEWAFNHETIDGYSAAKLQRYDDILQIFNGSVDYAGEFANYLIASLEEEDKGELNTPILNMLNAKYIIAPANFPEAKKGENISKVYQGNQVLIYQNNKALPKAWFVENTEVIESREEMLKKLKDNDFDPAKTALLEENVEGIKAPDEAWIKPIKRELHELQYQYSSDTDAFAVFSEVYYPAGWKAFVGQDELKIYAVNHALRGIKLPKGEHTLRMEFKPDSYKKSVHLSLIGLLISTLLILSGIVQYIIKRKRNKDLAL